MALALFVLFLIIINVREEIVNLNRGELNKKIAVVFGILFMNTVLMHFGEGLAVSPNPWGFYVFHELIDLSISLWILNSSAYLGRHRSISKLGHIK